MPKIALLDGGTGQEVFKRAGKPNSPLWSVDVMLNQPNLVTQVHSEFINAGCRTLTLNTYTATPTRLKRAGLSSSIVSIYERAKAVLNDAIISADVAVDRAGCLPPLNGSYLANPPRSFGSMLDEFRELCALQSDMDMLLIETMSNSDEALAACSAAQETGLPYTLGLRIETDGLSRSGEELSSIVEACLAYKPSGIWINCSAPEDIQPGFTQVRDAGLPYGGYANGFVSVEPLAAGHSVALLGERSNLTPEVYSNLVKQWIASGARLIGGCCEIGPDHMKMVARTLEAEHHELVSVRELLVENNINALEQDSTES